MTVEEYSTWVAYFELKFEEEQKELKKMKFKGKRR